MSASKRACSGYWGCASTANRIVYACAAVAAILGAALLGVGAHSVIPEARAYRDCIDANGGYDATGAGPECYHLMSSWAWPCTIAGICLLGAAVLSLSWFCCCSGCCAQRSHQGSVLELPLTNPHNCSSGVPIGVPVYPLVTGMPTQTSAPWSVKGTFSEKLYVEGASSVTISMPAATAPPPRGV